MDIYIVGNTEDAVAETAALLMSLEEPTEDSMSAELFIGSGHIIPVDFQAAGSQCLAHMLDADPDRFVRLFNLKLNVEQSAVLATASHTIELELSRCRFEDGGTTFVDKLEERASDFGSLFFEEEIFLSDENLKRLLAVDRIGSLFLPLLDNDELALAAFSARAKFLDYDISSTQLGKATFAFFDVVTTQLSLRIKHDGHTFPTDVMVPFWRRIAALGHFVHMSIQIELDANAHHVVVPACILQEILRAVVANRNLECLALFDRDSQVYLEPHLATLFDGLKDHQRLRSLRLFVEETESFGPNFSFLRQFLSHNKHIRVTDEDGNYYTDGKIIEEIYSLNAFYRDSAKLAVQPAPERPLLVVTALMRSASKDIKRSALLLTDHVDVLRELVQFAILGGGESFSLQALGDDILKRKLNRKTRK
jgi:hypothetical protein